MTVVILGVLVGLVILSFKYLVQYKNSKFPPGPCGVPILGYLPFLGRNPAASCIKLGERYGPLFSLKLGSENWIVLNKFDVIHEAFIKRGHEFSGRKSSPVYQVVTGPENTGMAAVDFSHRWLVHRSFTTKALKRLGGKFEKVIAEEAEALNEVFSAEKGKAFNPEIMLARATANVLMSVVTGKRRPYDDPAMNEIVTLVKGYAADDVKGILFGILNFCPNSRFLPGFRQVFHQFDRSQKCIRALLEGFIKEHKMSFIPSRLRDFIDEFLLVKQQSGDDEEFSDSQLAHLITELFMTGTEPSSNTIIWCILVLAHFPNFQNRIAYEIEKTIERDSVPTYVDRNSMPFTCAFVHEINRMFPDVPFSVPKSTTTDVYMRGYKIPKDTSVITNIYGVHHDPDNFTDPEIFRPERFIDRDGKFVPGNRVVMFSMGSRSCVGEQLARKEMFIFLVSIVRRFHIEPDPEKPLPSISEATFGLSYSPLKFEVCMVEK